MFKRCTCRFYRRSMTQQIHCLSPVLHRLKSEALQATRNTSCSWIPTIGACLLHTSSTPQAACSATSKPAATPTDSCSAPKQSMRSELGGGIGLGQFSAAESDSSRAARSLLAGGKRFYETVQVVPCHWPAPASFNSQVHSSSSSSSSSSKNSSSQGYQVLLRHYPVKTPAKNALILPTLGLALAIAAEWEWLPNGKPLTHRMPLTGLACTAIDQPKETSRIVGDLIKYVHTDAACVRYEDGELQRRQQQTFDPLLSWAREKLNWKLHSSSSIFGTTQSDATVAAVEHFLQGLTQWQLAAVEQLVTSSKSLVIAAAVHHGQLTAAEAIQAARLEEDYQLEDWGMVEAGHDLDIADTCTRIGAPVVFLSLLHLPAL